MAEKKTFDSTTEEGIAAASYVLTFYKEVMTLTHWKSLYKNLLTEMAAKNVNIADPKISDNEKEILKQYAQSVRYYADKTQTLYFSMINDLNLNDKEKVSIKKIKDNLKVIEESFIIPKENIDSYTAEIHAFLLKDVIKGLLKSAQDIIESVYGKPE